VAVGSGKGGVGKSTVALNVAMALADRKRVGLLDADVYGPNIAAMVNIARREPLSTWTLGTVRRRKPMSPVERFGIHIMSVGFLISEDQAIAWDASLVRALMHQLLFEVNWNGLDLLVIDLPPGTGDIPQAVMESTELSGAVVVVTPDETSHLDAARAVEMYRAKSVSVLGGIENMSSLTCPRCAETFSVFRQARPDRTIWAKGIRHLGSIPLEVLSDEDISRGPAVAERPDSTVASSFRSTARALDGLLDSHPLAAE
jgi:ATP-binding protein involved in chromosome partitioning